MLECSVLVAPFLHGRQQLNGAWRRSVPQRNIGFRGVLALSALIGVSMAVQVPQAQSGVSGLDFPGSAAVSTTMRFEFVNPQNAGLPIYGPGGNGVTYIWRAYPRRQAGYYTAFFWGNSDGNFFWGSPGQEKSDTYYGAHPYPSPAPNGTNHNWEISVHGEDIVNGAVQYDRWFTQVFQAWSDGSGKHHVFYWDWPNTDAAHTVRADIVSSYGNTNPPRPALVWGDAPWAPGNEVWNGILRGFQFYNARLSLNDIAQEIASPVSSAQAGAIWYLNLNPTPSDISDRSGKGHHPVWVGSQRPGLYGAPGSPAPAPPSNLRIISMLADPGEIWAFGSLFSNGPRQILY
jgi:hypothetical protein